MSDASAAVIRLILEDEVDLHNPATWARDVRDGKGITRFGQTPAWLTDNGFDPPAPPDEAAANYQTWMDRFRLTALADIDLTIGHLVTDDAVHAGEDGAIRRLQHAIGRVDVDGVLGSETLGAIAGGDRGRIARGVLAEKIEHRTRLLGSVVPDRRANARGWGIRLAKQVRALP